MRRRAADGRRRAKAGAERRGGCRAVRKGGTALTVPLCFALFVRFRAFAFSLVLILPFRRNFLRSPPAGAPSPGPPPLLRQPFPLFLRRPPPGAFSPYTGKYACRRFYILSIRANTTACCSSLSLDQRLRSSLCESVRETGASFSANSWESVIPNAAHIFSREGTVGTIFLRYHEDIVDCGSPERSAS